jgi:hypothetical protein
LIDQLNEMKKESKKLEAKALLNDPESVENHDEIMEYDSQLKIIVLVKIQRINVYGKG